jgi:hypothetical protein
MGADGVRDTLSKAGKKVDDDVVDRLVQQASQPDGITIKTTPVGHIHTYSDWLRSCCSILSDALGLFSGSTARSC